jgi:hypothetical protein
MNIYVQIMFIYGITFLVSMFIALIIWGLAKLIGFFSDNSLSIKGIIANMRQSIVSNKAERNQFLKQFPAAEVKVCKDLNNYHHERA